MPKKRHQARYSKPPTTAPASLSLSSSRGNTSSEQHDRSVNNILADMRRASLNRDPNRAASAFAQTTPSVPPELRRLLRIPDTPAPPPRRPQRHARLVNGRRIPPGPPPPRSWISLARSPASTSSSDHHHGDGGHSQLMRWPLPGAYYPEEHSLVGLVLRRIALDWERQRDWNRFYLYKLPNAVRSALLNYIAEFHEPGLSLQDLQLILAGPPQDELDEYEVEAVDFSKWNTGIFCLDLSGCLEGSLSMKDLSNLIVTPKKNIATDDDEQQEEEKEKDALETLQDSWDAPEPTSGPLFLLPNLTHLSLAIDPAAATTAAAFPKVGGGGGGVSWKQILSFASKWPGLTHLSLAGWPEPSLTPNAKYAKMVSPTTGQAVSYGGTGPYSHSLDEDWFEAVTILRKLSRSLYGLEYLDLTGCGDWWQALDRPPPSPPQPLEVEGAGEGGDASSSRRMVVDWVGDWGKITTLRLCSGYSVERRGDGDGVDATVEQRQRVRGWYDTAKRVESHIREQREGKGRFITVEKDRLDDF